MSATQHYLDLIANNLANVSTNGYKRDMLAFKETMVRTVQGANGENLGSMGFGVGTEEAVTIFEPGNLIGTNNVLDLAILTPQGAFAVQSPRGLYFSRDGAFRLNSEGELVDRNGYQVLDANRRPIKLPQGDVAVNTAGEISVDGEPVGTVGVFVGKFSKLGNNLLASQDATPMTDPTVKSGAVEGSNVNAIESMIQMITLGRTFEMSQRSIQQQDDMNSKLIQSLNDR